MEEELRIEYPSAIFGKATAQQMLIDSSEAPGPWRGTSVTKQLREEFVNNCLPTRIQTMLNQEFGKESLDRCFALEASLRLVLLPLYRSAFLDAQDQTNLELASSYARLLTELIADYKTVDSRSLQGYPPGWATETELNQERLRMSTAAALRWDGDLAAVSRWVGGPHVGEHRDHVAILAKLKPALTTEIYNHLARIWMDGVPNYVNVTSTEENFQDFLKYGNHSTVDVDPTKTRKAIIKDNSRGYCLTFDIRLVHFLLNCHVTPQGMVDLDKPHKKPRGVFDSTFRPNENSMAINDWTSMHTEPPIMFPGAFVSFLRWIYALRVSFPHLEIYAADDDASGAFRHNKYHPNVVAMHCFLHEAVLCASTGTTFGDTTSPGNFEPIAQARQQYAQYIWHDPEIVARAAPYLPAITMAPKPTEAEIATFQRADPDPSLPPVFDTAGRRLPPPFNHHVDDNIYADVEEHLVRSVSASAIALFEVLGYPDSRVPNPLSLEKLETHYNHLRKALGNRINTRTLSVDILLYKREQVIELLSAWIIKEDFLIRELAELHGTLVSICQYNRWGRTLFCTLQNTMRLLLRQRYFIAQRHFRSRGKGILVQLEQRLSHTNEHRLSSLVARAHAALVWNCKWPYRKPAPMQNELEYLRMYLADFSQPWSQTIGHIIPRDHHLDGTGDASPLGGGAFLTKLRIWFDVYWSLKIRTGLVRKSGQPNYVHINCLEFIVVILQLASAIAALEDAPSPWIRQLILDGLPAEPILLAWTDNTATAAWANRATTSSLQAQNLVKILAELLLRTNIGLNSRHIPGKDNVIADFLSRPTDVVPLDRPARLSQIFRKYEHLKSWSYFHPNPKLSQLLSSALFSSPWAVRPVLPKKLGQFVQDVSTSPCSPTI